MSDDGLMHWLANITSDIVSVLVMIGSLFQYLPSASALLTFIWMAIRIYESKTVQRWLGRDVS
jgi:hypothetical protein